MELNCNFFSQVWMENQSAELQYPLYTCKVTSASISEPNTRISSFNGVHLPGKSDLDVEGLSFDDTEVKYFPRDLFLVFPNLTAIAITNCGLKVITRRDLVGLNNLTSFNVRENELKSVPSNLFTNMKKLRRISFGMNKLESVSVELFKNLDTSKLVHANFLGNVNIDAVFQPGYKEHVALEDLMKIIETKCSKPDEDERRSLGMLKEFSEDDWNDLWTSKQSSDVVVIVGSEQIRVHTHVLAKQSPVFAATFENDMQERRTSTVEIVEFSFEAVETFFHFLYTGEIPEATHAMELFALAVKYDVPALTLICEDIILENVDQSNAFEVLTLGNLYSSDDMKNLAFAKIKKIVPAVALTFELKSKPQLLKELLKAEENRQRKIQEVQDEFELILKAWRSQCVIDN